MVKTKVITPHKTKKVIIKEEEVDELIAPLINWLNSFPHIHTKWSCQGEIEAYDDIKGPKNIDQGPLVIFYCEDEFNLLTILHALQSAYAKVTANYFRGNLRYILRFDTKKQLKVFIEANNLK